MYPSALPTQHFNTFPCFFHWLCHCDECLKWSIMTFFSRRDMSANEMKLMNCWSMKVWEGVGSSTLSRRGWVPYIFQKFKIIARHPLDGDVYEPPCSMEDSYPLKSMANYLRLTFLYLKPAVNHKPGFKVLIIIILQADKNYSRRSKNSPDFFFRLVHLLNYACIWNKMHLLKTILRLSSLLLPTGG